MIANRNWAIWCVAGASCLIVLAAMGVVTQRFMQQSNQDALQGAEAYQNERVRLAMWRLDTLATSIVGAEDARPAEDLYSQAFKEEVNPPVANASPVSQLYANPPEYANLYWSAEMNHKGAVAQSAQVYEEDYLIGNQVDLDANGLHSGNLDSFNRLLARPSSKVIVKGDRQHGAQSNFVLTCQSCHDLPFTEGGEDSAVAQVEDIKDFTLQSLNNYAPAEQKDSKVVRYKNAPEVQEKFSKADKGKRQRAVERLSESYISGKQGQQWGVRQNLAVQEEVGEQVALQNELVEPAKVSAFAPLWLDDELVLVRRVQVAGIEKMQGVWLNKEAVVAQLLAEIVDLFPNAKLIPYINGGYEGASENAMLKLPFVLLPEENGWSSVQVTATDVLYGPVGLAWLGIGVAILTSFLMLRAVIKMSERRASFVSSVTHELRTPLTTFRLYSDMLSSGLVKDDDTRQKYIDTLRVESERLTHLVENVLAYSRIERGSARAKVEEVGLADLLGRIEARLRDRAAEAGMQLTVQIAEQDQQAVVRVDTTAVEQILFNLVDNAAKYACGDDCGDLVELTAAISNGKLRFKVCDQGEGISRKELRKLFKPFHKSAEQAANTKPGVGLGLSLCRRLARAMKGDLVYERTECGACFVLVLPK